MQRKKQVGSYYSTKIWSFTMKAACCKLEIIIHTDPKNCEYVIINGAKKKQRILMLRMQEHLNYRLTA